MLVLCVGMYRACSTWQYGVAALLLERHRDGRRLGFADGDQFVAEVEPTLDPSGWSILKAHNAHPRFAELLAEGKALAIYSHRDLRDVAFSWMHKTGTTFREIVERDFLRLCLHNDWFYRGRAGTLLQSYESLIAEPVRGVEEIAAHLGIELAPGEAVEVADALSLEANRKRTDAISERLQAEGVPLDSKDLDHYDRRTLLHWNHLRSGRAGAWRDVASPEEKATIARICGHWLVERGYEPDRRWAEPLEWESPFAKLPRVSFARNGEDILLDRLFGGQVGTHVTVGPGHPSAENPSYYFYLRGWRGVNLASSRSSLDLFGDRRPDDLNLITDAPGSELAERIEPGRLVAPDLFTIDVEADPEAVLRSLPLASWRPRVFVVGATREAPAQLSWESNLLDQGYLFAAFDGINRFYLRDDLADQLPLFATPVNPLDDFARAETVELREQAAELHRLMDEERRRAVEAHSLVAEDLAILKIRFGQELEARHRDYLGWLDEREAWRLERLAAQAEKRDGEATRAELAARIDELEARNAAYFREIDGLHGVIGRLKGQIDDRDAEIARTRAQLRPYLRLDRLGVVPALQKKVHAHRAHS